MYGCRRVQRQVVLMVVLRRIERPPRLDGGDDLPVEHPRLAELVDVGLRHLRLRRILRKDRRAILRARVRPLPVQLRRIVRHREIDLQQLAIADLFRIERHRHRFGVPGARRSRPPGSAPSPPRRRHSRRPRSSRRSRAGTPPAPPRSSPRRAPPSRCLPAAGSSSAGAGIAIPSCAPAGTTAMAPSPATTSAATP